MGLSSTEVSVADGAEPAGDSVSVSALPPPHLGTHALCLKRKKKKTLKKKSSIKTYLAKAAVPKYDKL